MIRFLWILVLLQVNGLVQGALTQDQALELFNQANQYFRSANQQSDPQRQQELYQAAVLAYERIITEGGIQNAKLFYNLANAYLLKGQIGKAILNYRRAERLDGNDANIQKNLAFARLRCIDRIPLQTGQQVLRILLFWHFDLPIRIRFFISCMGFGLFCIVIACMIWVGRSGLLTTVAALGLVIMCAAGASVLFEQYQQSRIQYGVITAEQVVARQGDGHNYPESFKAPLHAGTEFRLLEQRPGWYHIQLANGSDCWIPADVAEII